MTITYFLLLHNNLATAKKLIDSLSSENVNFYIHVDKKCNDDLLILKTTANIYLAKERISVEWGGFSIIDVLIKGCNEIRDRIKTDYVILLSGTDYPIKSNEYIYQYIERNREKDFIEGIRFPSSECHWLEGGRRRIECYAVRLKSKSIATVEPKKFSLGNFKQFIKTIKDNPHQINNFIKIWSQYPKRRHPISLKPFRGEMWWGLRISTITKILEYLSKNPAFIEYHRYTCIPDEIFFPTLVHNIISQNEIENNSLRYINWGYGIPGNSPLSITLDNKQLIDKILNTDIYLFARKVTPSTINYIDSKK